MSRLAMLPLHMIAGTLYTPLLPLPPIPTINLKTLLHSLHKVLYMLSWVRETALSQDLYRFLTFCFSPHSKFCGLSLVAIQIIRQHLEGSSIHNQCSACAFDGRWWKELYEHYRFISHRAIFWGWCEDGNGLIWDPKSKEYQDHVRIKMHVGAAGDTSKF